MSAISEKVRVALYDKIVNPAIPSDILTELGVTGVFESLAPDGQAMPYVIFQRQASEPVTYSMGAASPTHQLETDLWLIKAVTDEDSNTAKEPQKLAEDILAEVIRLLGTSLTISGNTIRWFARFADMPPFQERLNDRDIYHRGFLLKVSAS